MLFTIDLPYVCIIFFDITLPPSRNNMGCDQHRTMGDEHFAMTTRPHDERMIGTRCKGSDRTWILDDFGPLILYDTL